MKKNEQKVSLGGYFLNLLLYPFSFSNIFRKAPPTEQELEEEVKRALTEWVDAVTNVKGHQTNQEIVEDVRQLYGYRAHLHATFSPHLRTKVNDGDEKVVEEKTIKNYFEKFVALKNLKCIIIDQKIDVYAEGRAANNDGLYNFTYKTEEGSQITLNGRFSFAYEKKGNKWLIRSHHSSLVPGDLKSVEQQHLHEQQQNLPLAASMKAELQEAKNRTKADVLQIYKNFSSTDQNRCVRNPHKNKTSPVISSRTTSPFGRR